MDYEVEGVRNQLER